MRPQCYVIKNVDLSKKKERKKYYYKGEYLDTIVMGLLKRNLKLKELHMGIRLFLEELVQEKVIVKSNKKKLTNDKNNKLIMLVPDQYTFQTEKKLLEYVGEKYYLELRF